MKKTCGSCKHFVVAMTWDPLRGGCAADLHNPVWKHCLCKNPDKYEEIEHKEEV